MDYQNDQCLEEKDTDVGNPSPTDFELFLPWACMQLAGPATPVITKIIRQNYINLSRMSTSRTRKKKEEYPNIDLEPVKAPPITVEKSQSGLVPYQDEVIDIIAYYDINDNLVHVQLKNNPSIPRVILQVMNLIIQFHVALTTITINRGLDEYIVHELSKLLHNSCITDICLDNTSLRNKTYYSVLLEKQSMIRSLSLCRCSLDDDAIEAIAAKLVYPLPASKTLSLLILTTNKITDTGAKHLAEALRSNRQLYYLNISDNQLSDIGVMCILDSLCEFPLHFSELLESRYRYMQYLKQKHELIQQKAEELRSKASEENLKKAKRKSGKNVSVDAKRHKIMKVESRSFFDLELFMEKATEISEKIMGAFEDPLSKSNTYSRDGVVYCYGNNTMYYINFSYNNLTLLSVKKLLDLVTYQKQMARRPKGLIDVSIEGNLLPSHCQVLHDLEFILDSGFIYAHRRKSSKKRHTVTKLLGNP